MPDRTLLATSGKLTTIIAITTAFHVNTTSMPSASSAWPTGLRRPNNHSSNSPVATGGSTSGSDTTVSTRALPGNEWRASTQPAAIASGRVNAVARSAISTVNCAIAQVSALTVTKASPRKHGARRRPLQELQEPPAFGLRRSRNHRGRLHDVQVGMLLRRQRGDDAGR